MDDYVITPEGRRLMRFDYLFKDTNAVREAQVVQERLGEIIIRLVVDESDAPAEVERLRILVRDWISPTIDVRFDIVRELERARNGKLRAVVSRLSAAQREGRAGA